MSVLPFRFMTSNWIENASQYFYYTVSFDVSMQSASSL